MIGEGIGPQAGLTRKEVDRSLHSSAPERPEGGNREIQIGRLV